MANQIVDVGSFAGDGTGDPLRDAFTKINENFAELYSGNIQVTAANVLVYSVAGRTGNVVLTVNDVAQAAAKSYVNSSIESNISLVNSNISALNANITAANSVISSYSSNITSLQANSAAQAVQINNLVSVKANIAYVDASIDNALSSNSFALSITQINANVAAANAAIAGKASLTGAIFSGNVQAGNIIANSGVISGASLRVGPGPIQPWTTTGNIHFTGDVPNYFLTTLQNTDPDGSAIFMVIADDGDLGQNVIAMGVNNSNYNDPAYPTGHPHDGYIYVSGGNLLLNSYSDSIKTITGNVVRTTLTNTGVLVLSSGTSIEFPDGSVQTTAFLGDTSIEANIAAANIAIAALQSNAATQATTLNTLISNAATQATTLNTLIGNAATQASAIISLTANSVSQSLDLDNLYSNAATQAATLNSLIANATSQGTSLSNLAGISSAQEIEIGLLNSNVTAANAAISSLVTNAAIQAASLASLTANAAIQSLDISNLYANLAIGFGDIASIQANANAANALVQSFDANLGTASNNILFLLGNAATQGSDIESLISGKANIAGQEFTGNVTAPYILTTANIQAAGIIEVGEQPNVDFPTLGGKFIGNVAGNYQLVVQNKNNDNNSASKITFAADNGTDSTNRVSVGINNSVYDATWQATGLPEFPLDGFMENIGGNIAIRTTSNVYMVANTSLVSLNQDSNFVLINCDLQFKDGTIQSTSANTANISYTMGNAGDWDTPVTTVAEALDQIAARLRALNG